MERKNQNIEQSYGKMKKKFKLRECQVKLSRLNISNNDLFRGALFHKYRIRECTVRINRLNERDLPKSNPKLLLRSSGDVRSNSNISWFPTLSTVLKNSANALSALGDYQNQNDIEPRIAGKKRAKSKQLTTKLQSARSMLHGPSELPNDTGRKKFTLNDMHLEFNIKYNSPNRGLKPCSDRQITEPQPPPLSDCQKIFNEIKSKLMSKNA